MTIKEIIKKFIPNWVLSVYHYKLALLGAVVFGCPGKGRGMKIIGVTGTSGKTTTSDFITRILEETPSTGSGQAGNKVASISTIRFKVGDKEWENKYKMTMPGRFVIQKFLKQARNAGCKYVVLEVTSQGIEQFRHKFINFDTAVFTNLSPEHIESHGSFENYRSEKLKFFKVTKNIHIVNIDDENSKYFLEIPSNQKICYSANENLDIEKLKIDCKLKIENCKFIKAANEKAYGDEIEFMIDNEKFSLNVMGGFNMYNALAAICVATAYGIDLATCKKALEKAKGIAGRMEVVAQNPRVIVDYAHTPEQLESVYKTLSQNPCDIGSRTKLICVLGSCGGGRDKWKRPVLGEIAKKYCDQIFITNEDPYDENPMDIIEQVAKTAGEKAVKILDRKEAIEKSIQIAKLEDTVIITGKGAEPWMCVANGKKIPWDDRKIAREATTAKNLTNDF